MSATTAKYVSLILGVLFTLLPLSVVLFASLKTTQEYALDRPARPAEQLVQLRQLRHARSQAARCSRASSTPTIVLVVSLIGTILIGTMAAYALDRFAFRGKKLVFGLFLLATLIPGVTSQVATFQIINGLGLLNTQGRADPALHGHRHHRDLHLHPVHAVDPGLARRGGDDRRREPLDHLLAHHPAAAASPRSRRSSSSRASRSTTSSTCPSSTCRPSRADLDVAVPVQGTVRRAVGGHRRRHDRRHHPHRHRLPAPAEAGSTRASPQEPSSEHRTHSAPAHRRAANCTPGGRSRPRAARRRPHPPIRARDGARRACTSTCWRPGSSPTRTSTTTSRRSPGSVSSTGRTGRRSPRRGRAAARERHDLVFDGLDTVATVTPERRGRRRDRQPASHATGST